LRGLTLVVLAPRVALEARLNARFDDLTMRFDRLESMLHEEKT
jgi:hypothetical protein